jgi:hypothetical protein
VGRWTKKPGKPSEETCEFTPYGTEVVQTTLDMAHGHIPLCVGAAGPVLRYTLNRCGAPSRSHLNILAALLRASRRS